MLTIFLSGQVTDGQLAEIKAAVPDAEVRYFATRDALEKDIEEADIVAGNIGAPALARATKLKWVQSWAAGPDTLMYPEMVASPVLCTSCKSNGAIPLAEHAIMLMLMLNRDCAALDARPGGTSLGAPPHGELNGLTCGIIGLGYSGEDLALKCKAFHMRVLGMRRTPQPTPHVDALFARDQLHELLRQSDFVVMTAPRTPESEGMLGEAEFRAMKPTAHYVCFSRGGIADDDALLRALREGWIAGAGLDAHGTEPLPAASPFWDLPNVIITPHNGATTPADAPARHRHLRRESEAVSGWSDARQCHRQAGGILGKC